MMNGYIIKYPDCIMDEVLPTEEMLSGKILIETIDLENVSRDLQCDFLVIPGGSCDAAVIHKELHHLIQKVKKTGLLAGICNGALVLASAGALKGEKCTHTAVPKYAPLPEFKELLKVADEYFIGSEYVDEDVVISNNIITAKPHAAKKFAELIRSMLEQKNL